MRPVRPIDASALFEAFERAAWFDNADRDDVAEELLLDAPTIDVAVLQPNVPLTADELEKIDGEPVWVELIEPTVGKNSGWALVYPPNTISGAAVQRWTAPLWYNEYGKTWIAYRFKKEEAHAKHIY